MNCFFSFELPEKQFLFLKADKIKEDLMLKGDLGIVAQESRSNQRMLFQPAALTVPLVFKKMKEIAQISGNSASFCFSII